MHCAIKGGARVKLGFFSTEYFRKHSGMAESDRELCKEFARIGYDVRAVVEDRRVPRGEVRVEWDGPVKVWRYQIGRFHPLSPRTYADKIIPENYQTATLFCYSRGSSRPKTGETWGICKMCLIIDHHPSWRNTTTAVIALGHTWKPASTS